MDKEKFYIPITVLLAFSALFLPLVITVALFILANILYRNYYVGLVIIFVVDVVYSFEFFRASPIYGLMTISALGAFLLIGALKESLFVTKRL